MILVSETGLAFGTELDIYEREELARRKSDENQQDFE